MERDQSYDDTEHSNAVLKIVVFAKLSLFLSLFIFLYILFTFKAIEVLNSPNRSCETE